MNTSLEPVDLWQAFSNTEYALNMIKRADAVYKHSAVPTNKALLGKQIQKPPGPLRARHASSIGAVPLLTREPATVFETVCNMDDPGKHEIQWALLTLIAIDEPVRESIASVSPPAAAKLTRMLPARFERYLIGSKDGMPSKTPYEAICDWTLRIEMVYKSVTVLP
jgi:hypothetical protein